MNMCVFLAPSETSLDKERKLQKCTLSNEGQMHSLLGPCVLSHPMNNSRRVDVLHAPEDLVDEELDVVVGELLRLDDVVEVRAHEVGDEVEVAELGQSRRGSEDVLQPDDLKTRYIIETESCPN